MDGAKTRKKMIENVLAARYASKEMADLFDREKRYLLERELWISILRLQIKNGLKVSPDAISAYEKVKEKINLESIDKREIQLKHDVKARIEEFNALAGHEAIHAGMTSRDLTENIEAWQIKSSLSLAHDRVIALLSSLGKKASEYQNLPIAGRSHNIPAQVTTLGKRFASAAEELLFACKRLS